MILNDTMIEDLYAKLEKIPHDKIRTLTKEDFKNILGVDLIELPKNVRMELARRLYEKYKVSQRWLAKMLRMSLSDVSKALKPSRPETQKVNISENVELITNAIKLVREGKARNPNDLVIELKIPLNDAKKLYDKIMENESITNVNTIEAAVKITKELSWLKNVVKEIEEFKNSYESIKEEIQDFSQFFNSFEKKADEVRAIYLPNTLAIWEIIKDDMVLIHYNVSRRLEKSGCKWLDEEGYCKNPEVFWEDKIPRYEMKPGFVGGKVVWRLNAKKHPLICVACPDYEPRGKAEKKQVI